MKGFIGSFVANLRLQCCPRRKKSNSANPFFPKVYTFAAVGMALMLCVSCVPDPTECTSDRASGPMFITETCKDPVLNQPVIDVDEWRQTDNGYSYRYVNGHFEESDTRFSFYFPPEDKYEGRFFHYTLPAPDSAPGTEDTKPINIEFGSDSGAYFVQTNGGGDHGN